HTLSVHWTGSVVAATAPPFVDAPVGAGEPVTVAEQPLRATAAAVRAAKRRVRERRIGDSVHGPPRGRGKGSKTAKAARPRRTSGLRRWECCGQPTVLSAGVSVIDVERRLVTTTAATMTTAATTAIT